MAVANHDLKGLAIGQVQLKYAGKIQPLSGMDYLEIECEIYRVGDVLSVHSVCPKCRHAQWIDGRNKRIEYDAQKGALFVEPFTCPWEMTADRHEFGIGLCKHRLTYTGKTARDS